MNENEEEHIFVDYVWTQISEKENKIYFFVNEETMSELDENVMHSKLMKIMNHSRSIMTSYNSWLQEILVWKQIFRFVIFSFENLNAKVIKKELIGLCESMNTIDEDAKSRRWIDEMREDFYDMAINEFLHTLRETNARKGMSIKSAN